jgi:hypothetical protein
MVVIQIKNGDLDGFLYETTCATTNDALVRDLAKVWNLRIRLRQLAGAIRELARHGPMKHPNKAGLDEINEKYNDEVIEKNEYYQPDPTGARNGNGVGPHLSETIERVAVDVEAILDQVSFKLIIRFDGAKHDCFQ